MKVKCIGQVKKSPHSHSGAQASLSVAWLPPKALETSTRPPASSQKTGGYRDQENIEGCPQFHEPGFEVVPITSAHMPLSRTQFPEAENV